MPGIGKQRGRAVQRDEMSIGYSDIWVGGGVDKGWVGTVLPKVLVRWMPSRLSPLVVAAMSAAAAAAAAAADDGGGGDDDDDDDNDNDDNYDDDDEKWQSHPCGRQTLPTTISIKKTLTLLICDHPAPVNRDLPSVETNNKKQKI